MPSLRRRLQSVTWIALFAMLGLALAPAVSHAVKAADASTPWLAVCSTSGVTTDAPAGDAAGTPHCPLCIPHDGWAPIPSAAHSGIEAPPLVAFAKRPAHPSPAPRFAVAATRARAPPATA